MTLQRSATTQALIDLEDAAPEILGERLPGATMPFWSQVRYAFSSLLLTDEVGNSDIDARLGPARLTGRYVRALLPNRWDASRWHDRRELAFLVGGTTLHRDGARVRNWLIDDYAEALRDKAVVFQRAPLPSSLGEPSFGPTRGVDPMLARIELAVGIRRLGRWPADARVRELIAAFADLLGIAEHPALPALTRSAVWNERTRERLEDGFSRVLDRTRPRVLVMDGASYGGFYATVVAAARNRGILVAELQHGWIGPTHPAYNYGALMHRPENTAGLPDVLLTFGDYWGSELRFPGAVVALGKPQLEQQVALAPDVSERPREVLVVSSVLGADSMLRFVQDLRRALPDGWVVRFRPHPNERAVVSSRYPGLGDLVGVEIDERLDVLESIARCRIVVGIASTVLFEAAAFGCRVFVRDSAYLSTIVGDAFGDPLAGQEGIERVVRVAVDPASSDDGTPRIDVAGLWRPRAVDTFTDWWAAATGTLDEMDGISW